MASRVCDLERAVGLTGTCPGATCAFWDEGGCVIAGLRGDLAAHRALARALLDLRTGLDGKRPSSTPAELPPGLRE